MISKELLSEVLDKQILEVKSGFNDTIGTERNYLYKIKGKGWAYINKYELAHKCKEWAISKEYRLENQTFILHTMIVIHIKGMTNDSDIQVTNLEATEPEAIFKACDWILDILKDKLND